MADSRHILRRIGPWFGWAAFLGVLVGLPIAVASRAPVEQIASVMARPRDAVIVTRPQRLTSLLGLTIDAGVLQGPKPAHWRGLAPLDRIDADGVGLTLDFSQTSPNSDAPSAPGTDLDRALAHLADLNFGTLVLRRSHLDILRADGATVRLTDIEAEIRATRKDAFLAKGSARYRGTRLDFEVTWSRPADPKSAPIYPLKLTVYGRALQARIDGRLDLTGTPKIDGYGEIKSPKLRVLARWLGLPVMPGQDLRNGSVVGAMAWSNGTLTFANATVALDGNQGAGALSLATSGARPKLDGTIAFKSFAMSRYLEALRGGMPGGPTDGAAVAQKSILALLDADLRLSAAKIQVPRLELGRAAVTLSLKNGRMLADLAEIEIEGGTASGQMTIDVASEDVRLGAKLRARGVDPGRALTELMKRNPLLGRVNASLEATGTGRSLSEVLRQLTGKGSFDLVDGGRLGLDLRALAHVAQTETATGWAAAGKGNTLLSALDVRFQIAQGGVQFDTITAKSGGAPIIGTGRIDIINRLLDFSISLGSASSAEVPVSNREVLRLHGPWSDPLIGLLQSAPPAISTVPAVKGVSLKGIGHDFKATSPVSVEAGQYSLVPQ